MSGDRERSLKGLLTVARIRLTIEITRGTWGSDCTVEQVYEQAGREAVNELNSVVVCARKHLLKNSMRDIKLVGAPEVVAVLAFPEGHTGLIP